MSRDRSKLAGIPQSTEKWALGFGAGRPQASGHVFRYTGNARALPVNILIYLDKLMLAG